MAFPKTMWITLTDVCNNNCVWCYDAGNNSEKVKYISLELVNDIVNATNNTSINKCVLIGGEPTLHPNLPDIVDMVSEIGVSISIVTNGRQFKNFADVQRVRPSKISGLVISVHGWSEETYLNNTGSKNGFSDLMKSISVLRENDVKYGVNIVLSKYTENHLDELIDFIKLIGVGSAGFNIASPIVSNAKVVSDAVSTMTSYRKQVMYVYQKCKENSIKANFLLIVPHCIFSKEELQILKESSSMVSGCQVAHGAGIVFKANGAIATCTHLSDFELACPEEVRKMIKSSNSSNSLERFWNSQEIIELRRMANCYRSVECKTCGDWDACGGGCLVHWAHHKPNEIGLTPL